MNKKERKANAIFAHAKEICNIKMAKLVPVQAVKSVVKPIAKPVAIPKPLQILSPVIFNSPEKQYDTLTIVKKGKGDYRLVGTVNGCKIDVQNRFKSITKAEEWKTKHLK